MNKNDPEIEKAINSARMESLAIKVKHEIKYIHEVLMQLYKSEVYLNNLHESRIGRVIKQLIDFCKFYKQYMNELDGIEKKADWTLKKLKNYVNN